MSTGPRRLVKGSRRGADERSRTGRRRLYFVHVPKTGGVTLKAYLEDQYLQGEAFESDMDAAMEVPAETLNAYRLWTGHFGSEVLDAIDPAPHVVVSLVREPLARHRSWAAHGRRSDHPEYRRYLDDHNDLEALLGEHRHDAYQAYWLARGLVDPSKSTRIPDASEIPDLLDRLHLVGVTEELDRFLQLLAFRMGWPPPPVGWHLNRRPESSPAAQDAVPASAGYEDGSVELADPDEAEIRRLLALDYELYAAVQSRFWRDYADMLSELRPSPVAMTPVTAAAVSVETVQIWLREHHGRQRGVQPQKPVERVELSADEPFAGSGWWWRESPGATSFRWMGPGPSATLELPPLVDGQYELTVELVGAVDWQTWDGLRLAVNGRDVFVVRERFGPKGEDQVTLRLHAAIPPAVVQAQRGATELRFSVPETRVQSNAGALEASRNTHHVDDRLVAVAIHQVRLVKVESRQPRLSLTAGHVRVA